MEWISTKLANLVTYNDNVSDKEFKIYKFGIQVGMESIVNILVSGIVAICLDALKEYILFLAVLIPIRSYAGGFHFRNFFSCLVYSCITINLMIWISRFIIFGKISCFLYTVISLIIINVCVPAESRKRQVDIKEESVFKSILLIISIYITLLSFILLILHIQEFSKVVFMAVLITLFSLLLEKFSSN